MEDVRKRLGDLRDEVGASTPVEKKRERIEFMSGLMGQHQHRISLTLTKGRLKGTTERVNGHVHKIDLPVDEQGDVLGFSTMEDNHKHRVSHTVKSMADAFKARKKEGK